MPLVKDGPDGPEPTRWYLWLQETIRAHPGLEVLLIDPKSRFFAGDENQQELNHQWVAFLEALAQEFALTVLFSHHVSKSKAADPHQHAARGASALTDATRWVATLTPLSEADAQKYAVELWQFIAFQVAKSNYAPTLPALVYLKRGPFGVLEQVHLEAERLKSMAEYLADLLAGDEGQYSRRDLKQYKTAKDIAQAMKDACWRFNRKSDFPRVVDFSIENGLFELVSIGTGRRPKEVIRVVAT
ncbi:MAG: helicase RepA family protein [Proteobacteria bacterium]|nr:helicase RepA family protein [Pseudomonadota bacterium]MBU1741743.1 helicase RepA family protein [Pseudomonadota bacterium]